MAKCEAKCEVYSRVCGYFRPVSNWNKGKREEFKDRKTFSLSKKTAFLSNAMVVCAIFALFLTSGCATEKIAESLSVKNVSGNGTVVDNRIGIDPETKIPGLKTVFISGDFATVKAGTNQVSYREESSASIWNAQSVTKKRFLAITLTDAGDVPMAIRAVAEVFKTAEGNGADTATSANSNGTERNGTDKNGGRVSQSVAEQPKTEIETKTAEVQKADGTTTGNSANTANK